MNISTDASQFVLLTDIAPDVLLDIRYYSTFNFIGERITGYEAPIALTTYKAAQQINEIAKVAKAQGYRLLIYDAYRPQQAVNHFQAWAEAPNDLRMKQYFYPKVNKKDLFDRGFILRKSAHSRGSTIDVTLFDMHKGCVVDMGSYFDFFGRRSHTDYTFLTAEQLQNRQLLQQLMVSHNFLPLYEEWWHFTLQNEPFQDTYFDFPIKLPFN